MKTNTTDTPETDAAIALGSDPDGAQEVCELCGKLERERDAALREMAEFRKDKERLDWLEKRPVYMENFTRQAIDAAREAQ